MLSHIPKVTEQVRGTIRTRMITKGGIQMGSGCYHLHREPTTASSVQGVCLCADNSHHLQGLMVSWGSLSPRAPVVRWRWRELGAGCRRNFGWGLNLLDPRLLTCAVWTVTVTVCPRVAVRIQEKHALRVH